MSEQLFLHKSVLLEETINSLNIKPSGIYVDCTLGGGGHSFEIAKRLDDQGLIIGIDQDKDAIDAAEKKLLNVKCNKIFVNRNFSELESILNDLQIPFVDGILFDLGVSSYQLDSAFRGFSYMQDGPLDMRMDEQSQVTAKDIVASYSEEKLADLIWRYGEERWAKRIAEFIVRERVVSPIKTTFDLVNVIKKAIPLGARKDGPHPAKRTFQAIRIEVNNELGILEKTFVSAIEHLKVDGRIAIITFHSLEDKIAKKTLTELSKNCICPPKIPVCVCNHKALVKKQKLIKPSNEEIENNPRSRSAKLRVATKI